jgi:glycosyltransferase involved in cell wall biosynthesis
MGGQRADDDRAAEGGGALMRVGIDCRKIRDFGIGTYIRGLLRELADVCVAFGPQAIAPMIPEGVEHVVVDAPHYSLRELIAIGRAADAARLDLFHAPHYVLPQMRTPSIVTVHDLIHLRRGPAQRLYARTMIRRAIRRSRGVLTVSDAVKRQLEQEFGAGQVVATPNGIDEIFFQTPHDDARPAASGYFLYVGNDKPHKNVDRLVAAFERADDARLVLAGAPFERFQARNNVVCAGFVEARELAALYRGAIALVMPSIEEGFGFPAAEAMACGTAVITSTAPALVEVTADAALHVDAYDVDAIAAAMRRVANDAALRDGMIVRGMARARRFTWSECARRTREAYVAAIDRA